MHAWYTFLHSLNKTLYYMTARLRFYIIPNGSVFPVFLSISGYMIQSKLQNQLSVLEEVALCRHTTNTTEYKISHTKAKISEGHGILSTDKVTNFA